MITIKRLDPNDKSLIGLIAMWYFEEWSIPIERTVSRLTNISNDDVLFQLVAVRNGKPIATGGLYNQVGILSEHPRFGNLKPWVALLYTDKPARKQGAGMMLLKRIEEEARELGMTKIYLYTHTAESMYRKAEWNPVVRVMYKGVDTVVMEKGWVVNEGKW